MKATMKLSKYFFATTIPLQKKGMIFSLWICLLFQVNIIRADQITLTDATGLPDQIVTIKLIIDDGTGSTLPNGTISLEGLIQYDTLILQYIGARVGDEFLTEVVILFGANESSPGVVGFAVASANDVQLIAGVELFELDFQILPDSLDGETIVDLIEVYFDEEEMVGLRDGTIMVVSSNTPIGLSVQVELLPGVQTTFAEVTIAGDTTATTSMEDPGPPGSELQFVGSFYDIMTTADYVGTINVCLAYDDSTMSIDQEMALNLYYLDNNEWFAGTPNLDTDNNIICADVDTLSWFGIVIEPDADSDGIVDSLDNCIEISNPDQRDTNGDGYGNICDPDLNNDGGVNFVDLGILKSNFFSADPDSDLNGDGGVNFGDLGIMKSMFFAPPGPSGLN